MVFNVSVRSVVAASLALALLLSTVPLVVLAQETDEASTERPARGGGDRVDFCENLDEAEQRALDRLEERKGKGDRSAEFESKRTERLAELDTTRGDRDTSRDEKYTALRERATTDEQSAAVETFIETVEDLVAERRTAVDAAITVFEDAVEDLKSERDGAVDDYASVIELEIENIFEDAEAACDAGTGQREVREDLLEDMKLLRDEIRGDRDEYSFTDELTTARETRQAAIDDAKAEFESAYEAAKETLKEAFGVE